MTPAPIDLLRRQTVLQLAALCLPAALGACAAPDPASTAGSDAAPGAAGSPTAEAASAAPERAAGAGTSRAPAASAASTAAGGAREAARGTPSSPAGSAAGSAAPPSSPAPTAPAPAVQDASTTPATVSQPPIEVDPLAYGAREDVVAFAREVAARNGLDAAWVVEVLGQARRQDSVRRLIMPGSGSPGLRSYAAYRARFLDAARINAGVAFWQTWRAEFERAERQYGVPAYIIAGVLGEETYYGRITGTYRVVDALSTLSFDFPTGRSDRTPFFRSELEQYLLYVKRNGLDPLAVKGSYAGAIGLPQFMPGSINRFAVDFDGDGRIDLMNSAPDAIGSIANYLVRHGWQPGVPTHFAVAAPSDIRDRAFLLVNDIKPTLTVQDMAARNALLEPLARDFPGLLALIQLPNGLDETSWVAGTQNFYAITRYNASSFYAMVVIDLGLAVAQRMAENGNSGAIPAELPRRRAG